MNRGVRSWGKALALAFLMLAEGVSVHGMGTEYSLRRHDLAVNVDTRWAGGRWGGYFPIRVRVVNVGKPRNLTFRFKPSQATIPEVTRTVRLEQNATERLTLSIPLTGLAGEGEFSIEEFGRPLEGMSRTVQISPVASPDAKALPPPSLLFISNGAVEFGTFAQAVSSVLDAEFSRSAYGFYADPPDDFAAVPPAALPESWLDYSGLDLIAISLETLAALGQRPRAALLEWAECGGSLLIFNAGPDEEKAARLDGLLGRAGEKPGAASWQPAGASRPELFFYDDAAEPDLSALPPAELEMARQAARRAGLPEVAIQRMLESLNIQPGAEVEKTPQFEKWPTNPNAFRSRPWMFGKLYAIPADLRFASREDWGWLLSSIGRNRFQFASRMGDFARMPHQEFARFQIPGVGDVPVLSYLFLMTLFCLLIGPVNYFWTWRRKQLHLLLLTIPAFALATSLSLFGYSIVSNGFGVKSRLRSVTLIDPEHKSAVTVCRTALYAGLTSSSHLSFSRETAVLPIWPVDQNFDGGTVDWSAAQQFDRKWLHPRTRTQFLTVENEPLRGRLAIGAPANGQVEIQNGLEWNLNTLIAIAADGRAYAGSNIAPGAAARLTPISREQSLKFSELLHANIPNFPTADGSEASRRMFDFGNLRDMSFREAEHLTVSFSSSLLETSYARAAEYAYETPSAQPLTFTALIDRPADLETGLSRLNVLQESHLLLGRLGELAPATSARIE